ncbi:NAD-dependent epimerase/dehydratase family protein [Patescibacteria group bacterium]|nr:NAD-dependent epimerase/dehydratase family protein [Patescibacteria group bacterium]
MHHLEGKKILVTGANGFIGSHLVKGFLEAGAIVYPVIGPGPAVLNVPSVEIDITYFSSVKKYFADIKPDIVYHLGAIVNLARDFEVGLQCVDINIKGTLNVLEASALANVKHFIFFSTQEVYGNTKIPYKEDQILNPPSAYAISKLAGENFCKYHGETRNLNWTVFRLSTAYGFGQADARFIPTIIRNAIKGEDIFLNSGKKKRDYIYIKDVIDCVISSGCNKNALNQVFNVGGGVSYSLKGLVDEIVKLTDSKSKIFFNKFPDRVGEADNMLSDISKAEKILGWKPKTSLNKGLKNTIEFHRKNQYE